MGQPTFQQFNANQNMNNYNPYTVSNPNLGDFTNQYLGELVQSGVPQQEAVHIATQAAVNFKAGKGPSPEGLASAMYGGQQERNGGNLARQGELWQQQQDAQIRAMRDTQNSAFGNWLVQKEQQRQANELAQSQAIGQMYEQSILGDKLRNMRLVDQPATPPTYTGK